MGGRCRGFLFGGAEDPGTEAVFPEECESASSHAYVSSHFPWAFFYRTSAYPYVEERRNAERDAMFAALSKKERERVKKYKELLEASEGERTSPMCIEIREFQAKADEIRKADFERRKEAKAKEMAEIRAQTKVRGVCVTGGRCRV